MTTQAFLPKIFADSSKISEIEQLVNLGIIEGITTNPLIVAKEAGKSDPVDYYRKIAEKFPDLPVSIQLLDNDLQTLLEQAHAFVSIAPNIVIKVPMFADGRGLSVLSVLAAEGIKTNVTGLMTKEQVQLALVAAKGQGPSYVSLFFNRIKDGGGNPELEIQKSKELIEKVGAPSEIITGSIRKAEDVFQAAFSGSHIVTVTPKVIWEMIEHPKSVEFINQSQEAWDSFMKEQEPKKTPNGKSLTVAN